MEFTYRRRSTQAVEVYYGEVKVLSLSLVYRELDEHPVKILLSGEPFGHKLFLEENGDIRWMREDGEPFGAPLAYSAPGIPPDQNPAIVALLRTGMLIRTENK